MFITWLREFESEVIDVLLGAQEAWTTLHMTQASFGDFYFYFLEIMGPQMIFSDLIEVLYTSGSQTFYIKYHLRKYLAFQVPSLWLPLKCSMHS